MDKRELILVRLLAIMALTSADRTFRNEDDISARQDVTTILFDGDENITENPIPRSGRGDPRVSTDFMILSPSIEILINASTAAIGTILNGYRKQIIPNLINDSELISLVGPNGTIRYIGCTSETQAGENRAGRMTLRFDLVYVFKVSELAS